MLKCDFYMQTREGVDLYRVYSDADVYIREIATGILYCEAINANVQIEDFEETDIPMHEPEDSDKPDLTGIKNGIDDNVLNPETSGEK